MRSTFDKLNGNGLVGMNFRNRDIVAAKNPRAAIALANDKIESKRRLLDAGIRVPQLLAAIHSQKDMNKVYPELMDHENGFVVKPSQAAQGLGVMIFRDAFHDHVLPHQDEPMSRADFNYYIRRILSGEFSMGRPLDAALIEQRICPDPSWILPDLPGTPDLRIIVNDGMAIMAMARLPTLISQGRANLHRGAIGLGIDLRSGATTHAIWKDRPISHHPDTGRELMGRPVEGLQECLTQAEQCARAMPLGFMGVDIMRDQIEGPMVIEINARPGLAIQLANQRGLMAA